MIIILAENMTVWVCVCMCVFTKAIVFTVRIHLVLCLKWL